MKSLEGKDNKIRVIVRVRPLIEEELTENKQATKIVIKPHVDCKHITLTSDAVYDREFEFNYVAHYKNVNQESFFNLVGQPRIDDIFKGINSTIIAYGQVLHL